MDTPKVLKLCTGYGCTGDGVYNKFVRRYEYNGATIYWEKTPSGLFTHQDYAIVHNDKIIHIGSYNHICEEEVEDMIDNYNATGKYNIKCIYMANNEPAFYEMHRCGDIEI